MSSHISLGNKLSIFFGPEQLDYIYSVVLTYVNKKYRSNLIYQPIKHKTRCDVNATVQLVDKKPEISFDRDLLKILMLFHANVPSFASQYSSYGKINTDIVQELFDSYIVLLYSAPIFNLPRNEMLRLLGCDDTEYYSNRTRRIQDIADIKKPIKPDNKEIDILESFSQEPSVILTMVEVSVKWLLLHEIGHVLLGHLEHKTDKSQAEFAADMFATENLLSHLNSAYDMSLPINQIIGGSAIPALFLFIDLTEFIIRMANNAMKLAIKSDFKDAYKEIPYTHPPSYSRIKHILAECPQMTHEKSVGRCWSAMLEAGVRCSQGYITLGLIDLRHFKRFSRICAEQMTSEYILRLLGPDRAKQLAEKMIINYNWDTFDLKPGALIKEVFDGCSINYFFPDCFEGERKKNEL